MIKSDSIIEIDFVLLRTKTRTQVLSELTKYYINLVNETSKVDPRDRSTHIKAIDDMAVTIKALVSTISDYV